MEVIMFFIFVEEMKQSKSQQVPGSWCTRSQITAVFSAEVGLGVGLKS